jgi:hypothetical protein
MRRLRSLPLLATLIGGAAIVLLAGCAAGNQLLEEVASGGNKDLHFTTQVWLNPHNGYKFAAIVAANNSGAPLCVKVWPDRQRDGFYGGSALLLGPGKSQRLATMNREFVTADGDWRWGSWGPRSDGQCDDSDLRRSS